MADADDLDLLLDSALDDFSKLDLASAQKGGDGGDEKRGEGGASSASAGPSSAAAAPVVQGLGMGMGLPGPRKGKVTKGKQKPGGPSKGVSPASEALEKLTQQTREAVLGLGAAPMGGAGALGGDGLDNERMVEDFVKQFEELSGSQDMESIVETMMQQLLSKEILHEPMKEIGERYPAWLEEHKAGLDPDEYDRYTRQYEFIKNLNEVYENDSNNFPKIVELMQKMQECGQPPNDIVQELAPDFDLANLGGQLSPEMLEGSPNCSIM